MLKTKPGRNEPCLCGSGVEYKRCCGRDTPRPWGGDSLQDNVYCRVLGIEPPRLEDVVGRREANNFGLFIAALLEHGAAMTLEQVALRFEQAGVASCERALVSLKRSRPATRPVHRDGDVYELDPHDAEAKLWVTRLELDRRRKPAARPQVASVQTPTHGPLSLAELDDAFEQGAILNSWSAQRLALAVLDAHGEPMTPERVVAHLSARTKLHSLRTDSFRPERSNAAVREIDGRWSIVPGHHALASARVAVRDRAQRNRERAALRPDPSEAAARQQRADAEATELFIGAQAIIVAHPPEEPEVVLVMDLDGHEGTLHLTASPEELFEQLDAFQVLIGIDIRPLLRRIGFHPDDRRLLDLGPPKETHKFSERGKPVTLTLELMLRGSCGIDRPFTSETTLDNCLARGDYGRLGRALESDAGSLRALYEYARLHGAMRAVWHDNEAMLSVGWTVGFESPLGAMSRMAVQQDRALEIVLEHVEDWRNPWANSVIAFVEQLGPWTYMILDELGCEFHEHDIKLARLADDSEPSRSDILHVAADEPAANVRPLERSAFAGKWRIIQMGRWDAEYFDMDGPAHIVVQAGMHPRGSFQFGLVWGEMDCRPTLVDDEPLLHFSWAGEDEGEPMSGRGWLSVAGDQMHGQIFIHLGDESTFQAVRVR